MTAPAPALVACPGCGALFPPADAATHRYIGASAGCWALFTPLCVGERPAATLVQASRVQASRVQASRADAPSGSAAPAAPRATAGLETLLTDAYAAQHHGDDAPQAVQSVAVHLLVLHAVLARDVPAASAQWVRRRALRTRGVFHPLVPPPTGAALTLRHLYAGGGVARPCTTADYVASVHAAWSARHAATLAAWYDRYVLPDRPHPP